MTTEEGRHPQFESHRQEALTRMQAFFRNYNTLPDLQGIAVVEKWANFQLLKAELHIKNERASDTSISYGDQDLAMQAREVAFNRFHKADEELQSIYTGEKAEDAKKIQVIGDFADKVLPVYWDTEGLFKSYPKTRLGESPQREAAVFQMILRDLSKNRQRVQPPTA